MTTATFLSNTTSGSGAFGTTLAAALQFFAASQYLVQEPWPQPGPIINETSYDFVIVGGGTAGATLAARLTEVANFSVLLVEAGGDPPPESIIPRFKDVLKGSAFDWNFTTVNDYFASQALQDGVQPQPRGMMLGGTGSLNDMVYARGFPTDYDEWATLVGDEWSWSKVLKYFKKTEHLTDERIINDPELMKYHSRGGEIHVAGLNVSTSTTDIFLEAFHELGFEKVKDMTNPNAIGVGRFSHTINEGRRDGSLPGLLNKAADRSNLYVIKNALVTKVLIENNTAYGVQVLVGDDCFHFYARKEVVLSAGTLNTPKLLLLSGVGPKKHLEDIGVEVKRDLPVGENLHDHVMVLDYLVANNGTCPMDSATLYFELIRYLYDRTGLFSATNSLGAYISLDESSGPNVPDFAIYPTCVPIGSEIFDGCVNQLKLKESICSKLSDYNLNRELITLAVVLLKPKSRGKLRLRSNNPLDEPLIYAGTFSSGTDLNDYPEALRIARSLVNTSHFKEKNADVVDLEIEGCTGLDDSDSLKCTARSMAMSAWHTVGTAALGTVLDERLKVLGMSGVRVVDASVMPKVIRGNTNAPVIMIAERAADFIKEEYAC